MNTHEFTEKALRTESIVERVVANKTELNYVLGAFVTITEMLDCLKKKIYYNNSEKYNSEFHDLAQRLQFLTACSDRHHDIPENEVLDIDPRLFHGVIGAATESGELVEALQKAINGDDADLINIMEEVGDSMWYFAILADTMGISIETAMERVIAKLKKRYPEKYTDDLAENRDLAAERAVLEGKIEAAMEREYADWEIPTRDARED